MLIFCSFFYREALNYVAKYDAPALEAYIYAMSNKLFNLAAQNKYGVELS